MKKRWAALLCAAALVFSLAACGGPAGSASHNEDSGSLRILATTYPVYCFTQAVTEGVDGVGAACYRYLPQEDDVFFCLKCESCGRVINIDCAELSHLYHHLSRAHNIRINPGKTMFYGTCETCIAKGRTEDAGAKEGPV